MSLSIIHDALAFEALDAYLDVHKGISKGFAMLLKVVYDEVGLIQTSRGRKETHVLCRVTTERQPGRFVCIRERKNMKQHFHSIRKRLLELF